MTRPSHAAVLATVRDFTERSGAVRVTAVVDRGDDTPPPLVECEPGEPLTVNEELVVPPAELAGVDPLPLALGKPVPASALDADSQTGEVAAPIGALEGLADAVTGLARALGGRTVAIAEFATRSGDPLTIAARPGEPVVLAIKDAQFQLPEQMRQG